MAKQAEQLSKSVLAVVRRPGQVVRVTLPDLGVAIEVEVTNVSGDAVGMFLTARGFDFVKLRQRRDQPVQTGRN